MTLKYHASRYFLLSIGKAIYLAVKYSHIKGNIIILQLLTEFVYGVMTLMRKNNSRNVGIMTEEILISTLCHPKIYFLGVLLHMKSNFKYSLFCIVEYI